jgi:CRP/FNR family nitrogen fixation transcriptional regulator
MGLSLNPAPAKPAAPFFAHQPQIAAKPSSPAPFCLDDSLEQLQGSREIFRPGETIFRQGEAAEKVYRILGGTIRLCRYAPDGRRSIVAFLAGGDLMGFGEYPTRPVSAETIGEVALMTYARTAFDRLAGENMRVRAALLRHMSDNLGSAQRHMFVLGCQKAEERVASFLLRMAECMALSNGDHMDLAMSRQDIGDHLGLTIETISRTITALRRKGVIFIPGPHQIILRDMATLRTLAAGSEG